MAEDTASAIPVLLTSTPDKLTDVSPEDIGTDEAKTVHDDAEQNIPANNDVAEIDTWNITDTEGDANDSDVDDSILDSDSDVASRGRSPSSADLKSDVKFLLGMVSRLKGMLKESLSVAKPQHMLRASIVLSHSISTEIQARLPKLKPKNVPSQRIRRPVSLLQASRSPSVDSLEAHMASNTQASLDDFVRSCEELRLRVSHRAILPHGDISAVGEPHSEHDVIVFWDSVGSSFETTTAPLLPRLYPGRNGESVDLHGKMPTLIRITSPLLQEMLTSITNVDLDKGHGGFIAAPFGALVFHSSRIQALIKDLRRSATEAEHDLRSQCSSTSAYSGSHPAADSSTPTVVDGEKQESNTSAFDDPRDLPGTPSPQAFFLRQVEMGAKLRRNVHFCLLIEGLADLLKSLAGPSLKVHDEIETGTLEVIKFGELWQLFTPGETLLYHKEGRDMACQVLNVSGGWRTTGDHKHHDRDLLLAPEDIASHTNADDTRPRDRGIPVYPGHLIRQSSSQPQTGSSSEEKKPSQAHGPFAPLIIDCFMMDFDGTHVGPCHIGFQFDYFPGERSVRSFEIYPLRFRADKDELSATLRERGRRVLSAVGHRTHNGMPLSGFDSICGQIYIDNAAGYRHIGWPKERLAFGTLAEHWIELNQYSMLQKPPMDSDSATSWYAFPLVANLKSTLLRFVRPETSALVEDCYLLMSYVVLGYAFQQRRWYYFDIDCVGSIDKSDEARLSGWKDLVIPSKFREMLVALVDSHASGVGRSARRRGHGLVNQVDLVRGKGNGLIILLHGPPGTGKTSTAETIAAYTRRPLYSITCGDIGTTAEEVEFNLQKHFDLANQWGCVLCLDEADVFLTKRDWHDLNRNSLVSVWLRVLEYYSGILFITTNRIGVIDEAFKSRIHICLRYPSINLDSTKSIWTKILDRIEAENRVEPVKIEFDRDAVLGFAEKHYLRNEATGSTWNGRQIRNVVQTAISLGQYERMQRLRLEDMTEEDAEQSGKPKYMRVELTRKNLKSIAATATEFEHYITNVRGADASVARNENVRDDDYDGSGKRPQKDYPDFEVARAGGGLGMGIGLGAGKLLSGGHAGGWPSSEDWGGVSETSYGAAGKGKKKAAVVDDDSDSSA